MVGSRALWGSRAVSALTPEDGPVFQTASRRWQAAYDKAVMVLAGNVRQLPGFAGPVLIEGSTYAGVWQECGPQEALVYRQFRLDVARNNHLAFFALQREDGQLPANVKASGVGFGQIQMVVPIAATAWELVSATGDEALLVKAYGACARWDAWLRRYRDTRGTGLVEGFCTYDTGMDNSPRWAGMPVRCPDGDARRCPAGAGLPRLCPDLSATVYGGRMALAAMARALGKSSEADEWQERAEALRALIVKRLYAEEDAAFYDLDAQGRFVKVRCDILSRICGERVVDQALFERMWAKQLGNPAAFWAPYPLPSVAMNDPSFVRPIPRNSWGGAAQALTALRAGRWMEAYGKPAEYAHLMGQWCAALVRDMGFRQQLDPRTGEFTQDDPGGYSPACLAMMDFTWRLAGMREEGNELHWTVRPESAAARGTIFRLGLRGGLAEMRYRRSGAELRLAGRSLGEVHGVCRLVTDATGKPVALVGVAAGTSRVELQLAGMPRRVVQIAGNQRVAL